MIPYKIIEPFTIGPIHINMYGIMFALGFLVAMILAVKIAKRKNVEKKIIEDLVIYIIIGSVIGARIFYLLFYWPEGVALTFFDIFKIWEGGLAFYGGFIGAIIASYIYLRKNNLNFWKYADIFTLPLIVGHIFGRIGDYLTGGHPGLITDLPWAIYLNEALRHPVVLYEIVGLLIIGLIIIYLSKKEYLNGFIFLTYAQLYALQRLFLDFFRPELLDPKFLGLTPTQYLVILIFFIATYIKYINSKNKKLKKTTLLVDN